jgi:hypothetical protein
MRETLPDTFTQSHIVAESTPEPRVSCLLANLRSLLRSMASAFTCQDFSSGLNFSQFLRQFSHESIGGILYRAKGDYTLLPGQSGQIFRVSLSGSSVLALKNRHESL